MHPFLLLYAYPNRFLKHHIQYQHTKCSKFQLQAEAVLGWLLQGEAAQQLVNLQEGLLRDLLVIEHQLQAYEAGDVERKFLLPLIEKEGIETIELLVTMAHQQHNRLFDHPPHPLTLLLQTKRISRQQRRSAGVFPQISTRHIGREDMQIDSSLAGNWVDEVDDCLDCHFRCEQILGLQLPGHFLPFDQQLPVV